MPPSSKSRSPRTGPSRSPWLGIAAVVAVAGALAIVDWSISSGPGTGTVSVGGATEARGRAGAPVSATGRGVRTSGRSHGGTHRGRVPGGGAGGATFFGSASSGAGAGGTPSGGPGPGGSSASDATAATQALDTYLQGLASLSVQEVSSSSDSGPFAVAGILLDAAAINSQRGATTTMSLGPSSFAPAGNGGSGPTVTLQGSVSLTTTISGSRGSGSYTDTISGPVTVTDEAGTWRVTDFTYDGLPVQVWPENQSQTVNGLETSLGYVVSYGDTTAALVTLRQTSGSADVQLRTATLRAGGTAENGVGDFTGPPAPTGVLRFSRVSSAPTSLTLLFSSSTGHADYFDFTLS